MSVVLITYDLNQPGKDYSKLHEAIKALGACWHCLDSTWLVETFESTADVRNQLGGFVDTNDKLLVLSVGRQWSTRGPFPENCTDWLRTNVSG